MECNKRNHMAYDEACLRVINPKQIYITLHRMTTECYKCNMKFWLELEPLDEEYLAVDTCYSHVLGFTTDAESIPKCNITFTFKQHGWYQWTASDDCSPVIETEPPDNPYIPLLYLPIFCIILSIICLLWKARKWVRHHKAVIYKLKRKLTRESVVSDTTSVSAATTQTTEGSEVFPVPQIIAFQVFRGIVIILLLIINGESKRYWFLQRTVWNGLMPADFIFPWFLWGMGAVLYLKYRSNWMLGTTRRLVIWAILRRSLMYIAVGVCLNSFENNHVPDLRIPGRLQKYGILHLIMFTLEMVRMKRGTPEDESMLKLPDLKDNWVQAVFTLVCMLVNLLVTYLFPVPGCPVCYTGPGGLHLYSRYVNCSGGAAGYLDNLIFTSSHLQQDADVYMVYSIEGFMDNQGILGTFNAVLTVFGGIQAARIFVYYSRIKQHFTLLLVWGFIQSILGLCLCGFSKENGPIPLNSFLWSLSFVLLTTGVAFLVFTGLYAVIDVCHLWSGTPFFETGLNSMPIFIGSHVLIYSFPFSWSPYFEGTYFEFVCMDFITVTFWIFISKYMFKLNKILII